MDDPQLYSNLKTSTTFTVTSQYYLMTTFLSLEKQIMFNFHFPTGNIISGHLSPSFFLRMRNPGGIYGVFYIIFGMFDPKKE